MIEKKNKVTFHRDDSVYVNLELSRDLGLEIPPKPFYYGYCGNFYYHFVGAIGWAPVVGKSYAMVLGVTKEDTPKYRILSLEARQSPLELFGACRLVQEHFGCKEVSTLMQHWIGEAQRFESIQSRFNKLGKSEGDAPVYVLAPPDLEKPNREEILISQLQQIISEKRLDITDEFGEVRDAVENMTQQETNLLDYPIVAALAMAVYETEYIKPWLNRETVMNLDDESCESNEFNLE